MLTELLDRWHQGLAMVPFFRYQFRAFDLGQ
jgi:hypothetical protein